MTFRDSMIAQLCKNDFDYEDAEAMVVDFMEELYAIQTEEDGDLDVEIVSELPTRNDAHIERVF